MKLHLRPPYGEEWQLCRMLLPETFVDASLREYLLCVRDAEPRLIAEPRLDAEPRLIAVLSFRRAGDEAKKLRIHVVPGFRRRGVGSQIVGSLLARGLCALNGTIDSLKEPGAANFCEREGFRLVEQLFTVEVDLAEMQKYLHRLRSRMGMPSGARLVRLQDAPFEAVARLHATEIAHSEPHAWRALLAQTKGMAISPVAMVGDEVVGFVLMELEGLLGTVRSQVIAPAYRGGWAMVAVLSDAVDTGCIAGCVRGQFSYLDSNREMKRLAQRFHARTVSVTANFRREAEGEVFRESHRQQVQRHHELSL